MVPPVSRNRSSTPHSCRRDCGSRPVVGSSRNSRSGRPAMAHATDRRCFCPPDSFPTHDVALRFELDGRQQLVDGRALGIERSEQPQRLFDGQLLGELRLLQLDAEPRAQPGARRSPSAGRAPRPRRHRRASRPSRISIDVVLPAPLGPSRPKHSPRARRGRDRRRPSTSAYRLITPGSGRRSHAVILVLNVPNRVRGATSDAPEGLRCRTCRSHRACTPARRQLGTHVRSVRLIDRVVEHRSDRARRRHSLAARAPRVRRRAADIHRCRDARGARSHRPQQAAHRRARSRVLGDLARHGPHQPHQGRPALSCVRGARDRARRRAQPRRACGGEVRGRRGGRRAEPRPALDPRRHDGARRA